MSPSAAGAGGEQPEPEAAILTTGDGGALPEARLPRVQAVIFTPPDQRWAAEVATAVEGGLFRFDRCDHVDVKRDAISKWLDGHLPWDALSPFAARALKEDLLGLVDLCRRLSDADLFRFRAHTDVPDTRCGFHVDTVPPGAPTVGVLRVYCGAGTEYVHPDNLTSVSDFYRCLSRRERLLRERSEAAGRGDGDVVERRDLELRELDEAVPFLLRGQEIWTVPPGAIVCFKHVDASRHWSAHSRASAWIHRSPMAGGRRFVVNVSARRPGPRLRRPPGSG